MRFHEQIRTARHELGLSQQKLADRAGVQRRQLATLERGGNVTLRTLWKVLRQLPNLHVLHAGRYELHVDHEERRVEVPLAQMIAAARRVVEVWEMKDEAEL